MYLLISVILFFLCNIFLINIEKWHSISDTYSVQCCCSSDLDSDYRMTRHGFNKSAKMCWRYDNQIFYRPIKIPINQMKVFVCDDVYALLDILQYLNGVRCLIWQSFPMTVSANRFQYNYPETSRLIKISGQYKLFCFQSGSGILYNDLNYILNYYLRIQRQRKYFARVQNVRNIVKKKYLMLLLSVHDLVRCQHGRLNL